MLSAAFVIDILLQPSCQVIKQPADSPDTLQVRMRDEPDLSLEGHVFGQNGDQVRVPACDIDLACRDAETGPEHGDLRRDAVGADGEL